MSRTGRAWPRSSDGMRTTRSRSAGGAGARLADELMDHGAAGELGPMRHSAAHVLAEAVLDLFPGTKLGIGPVIDDGFYYDFLLPRPLTPDDLPAIEARMRESDRGRPPVRVQRGDAGRGAAPSWSSATSRSRSRSSTTCWPPRSATARRCRGRPSTGRDRSSTCAGARTWRAPGKIGPFKLLGTAGAYWRGDEKRPMLQRVYGTAWATQEELDPYLWRREEAKKRDHRRLGVQLDLFSFHDVSPGLRVLAPQGPAHLAHARDGHARAPGAARLPGGLDADRGREKLWQQSGHWDLYRDNMFLIESEDQTFSLKPMNCPESHVHLPLAPALVPRPAAPLQRVRPAASQRAVRHAVAA